MKNDTVVLYSDRLMEQNPNKWFALCEKHFNGKQSFREHDKVEAWLKDYFNTNQLELVKIREDRNCATGFPVWVMHVKLIKE